MNNWAENLSSINGQRRQAGRRDLDLARKKAMNDILFAIIDFEIMSAAYSAFNPNPGVYEYCVAHAERSLPRLHAQIEELWRGEQAGAEGKE